MGEYLILAVPFQDFNVPVHFEGARQFQSVIEAIAGRYTQPFHELNGYIVPPIVSPMHIYSWKNHRVAKGAIYSHTSTNIKVGLQVPDKNNPSACEHIFKTDCRKIGRGSKYPYSCTCP